MKKLRVNKLSIYKQLGVCVKPSLSTSNVEAKMFNKRNAGVSQVKRKASSKRNASGIRSSFFLRTSTDVVTQFFFPFNRCGKVASRKKLALSEEDILARKVSDFFFNLRRSTKIKKKKRGVRHRMAESRNVFPDGMNARKSAPRLRKTRKKKETWCKEGPCFGEARPCSLWTQVQYFFSGSMESVRTDEKRKRFLSQQQGFMEEPPCSCSGML